jgi:hypothetical protein
MHQDAFSPPCHPLAAIAGFRNCAKVTLGQIQESREESSPRCRCNGRHEAVLSQTHWEEEPAKDAIPSALHMCSGLHEPPVT